MVANMVGTSGRGKFMVWRDLTAEALQLVRHPHPSKGLSGRDHIALAVGISPKQQGEPKNAIDLDLYVQTLQYAEEHGFADDKTSGLFSIVREVHRRAAGERLTLEVSFAHFKHLLLIHSVHRPPQSIALFTYAEMRGVLTWMVDTYYRHYKLYQYTFTNRCTMSVASRHPLDIIELPPLLPPLMEALTEAQHQAQVAAQEAEEAAARKVAEQQAAEEAEQERLRLLREAYVAATGDEIRDRINSVLQKEVGLLRQALNQEFNLSLPPVDGGKGHFPAIKSKNDGPRLARVDAAATTTSLGDPAALEPGLHVKLVSATGLKNMDFYGKMDPYARLVLGGQKHTSLVADDSGTEPVWNQAFLFKQYEQEKILQVTLVDDDAGPIDETIGTVAVSLAGAKAQSGELQLLELPVMLPSGKPMGKLTLELCAVVAK